MSSKCFLATVAAIASALSLSAHSMTLDTGPAAALTSTFSGWSADTFDGLAFAPGATTTTRSAGSISYTAAAGNGLFAVGEGAQRALSVNSSGDALILSDFGANVRAIAGVLYATRLDGTIVPGDFSLIVTEVGGPFGPLTRILPWSNGINEDRLTQTVTPRYFFSVGATPGYLLQSIQITATESSIWATLDNLVIAVPEPGTYALMLLGLATVMAAKRRQTARS